MNKIIANTLALLLCCSGFGIYANEEENRTNINRVDTIQKQGYMGNCLREIRVDFFMDKGYSSHFDQGEQKNQLITDLINIGDALESGLLKRF
jgi:hypothetical protein